VYKYDSFVGFIGDALVEAQECYECFLRNEKRKTGFLD
jgi:hypothetical protein